MFSKHMRIAALLALGVPTLALAEEVVWRPAARTPPPVANATETTRKGQPPVATLGRPIPIGSSTATVVQTPPTQHHGSVPIAGTRRGVLARASSPDSEGIPPPPPPLDEIRSEPLGKSNRKDVDEGIGKVSLPDLGTEPKVHRVSGPPDAPPPPSENFQPGVITDNSISPSWWEKTKGWMSWGDKGSINGRCGFQSDHCFEGIVSPVTMPFYFEDPRALTELRPIFMYQSVPKDNPNFRGGDAYFFGTQARIALSECFSIVLHELGIISFNPDTGVPPIQSGSGLAEVKLGAKYTFLRNSDWGSLAAVGVIFEIPTGSSKVFQDTGEFSVTPYLSYAQQAYRLPGGFGSLNFMGNMGYSFSSNNQRSEFFYSNLHLDYNVAGLNAFYPLIELNWIHYTKNPNNVNLGFEGADLVNFGSSTRQGKEYIALAIGARYRFSNNVQVGAAASFPVSNEKGLNDYRLTFDLILRY